MWPEDEPSPVTTSGAPCLQDPQKATGSPRAMPAPRPKLTSSPEAPLPLSASSTELAVTLLACERYRLVPASGPGPPPPTLPSLECGNHVDCYLPWYPHRPPKGAMPNVAW